MTKKTEGDEEEEEVKPRAKEEILVGLGPGRLSLGFYGAQDAPSKRKMAGIAVEGITVAVEEGCPLVGNGRS